MQQSQTTTSENKPIIFIDGSYYCFHRFYSIKRWFKNAYPEIILEDPSKNDLFVEKFKKTFVETIRSLPSNLGVSEAVIVVGKDCPRKDIWRMELYDTYKGTRDNERGQVVGPFFEMAYQSLFEKAGAQHILSHPRLESDDCIALSVKYIVSPETDIKIITSDRDYLQLASRPNIQIFDLSLKNISEGHDPKKDLFCKIVMGDSSDNISSVLKKCGPKTAIKCFENQEYFDERMKKEDAYSKLELNKTLVNFDCIPEQYKQEFMKEYNESNTNFFGVK